MSEPAPEPTSSARRRKTAWPFYAAIGLILAALPVGYFFFLSDEKPPALAPPPPSAAPVEHESKLTLAEVQGTVEIKRANGEWKPAAQGETLQQADAVRTQDHGSAVLDGEKYQVKMESSTEIAVDQLTSSISRVQLGAGMATAEVKSGKHVFEVRAVGSDAVARTSNGSFAISNNGAGTVAVGTRAGEVEFAGHGKMVIVRAGQQSVVRPGEAPSEPSAIPSSLLLKVQWPGASTLTTRKLVVQGQTEPGARVEIGGRPVAVDQSGRFARVLSLEEGKNALEVRARSVGSLEQTAAKDLNVDTHGPGLKLRHSLWDTPRK